MREGASEILRRISHLDGPEDLKDALWNQEAQFIEQTTGRERVAIAKGLSWEQFEFDKQSERECRKAAVLEVANNETLAVLGRDGTVYQLGDVIRFETTRSRSGWGRTSSQKTYTVENQIDYLGEQHLSISKEPTYSNVPRDSPSATPGRDDITIVKRSDLRTYRDRLTEGTDIDLPEEVNGWELDAVESRDKDPEEALLPTDVVTRMEWSNNDGTRISAHWRGSYNCWHLSVPVEGTVCEENTEKYLYEIDLPQQVAATSEIVSLAVDAMQALEPADFQATYDLRDSETADEPRNLCAEFVPTDLPDQLGDWHIEDRRYNEIRWENTNPQSAWADFSVKIDFQGGVTVKNEAEREIHDRRLVEKRMPSGKEFGQNIDEDYAWRRREMWDDNWMYGMKFLKETSKQPVVEETWATLEEQSPVPLASLSHGLSVEPHETMDRENGTLLAY